MVVPILTLIALLSCLMYTGASLYASLVEHPARMSCGTELAARVFAPSYGRALRMLFTLVLLASINALGVWTYTGEALWFVGSVTVFTIIPFTILAVTPILGELLQPGLDPASPRAALLLHRWGWLNMVRSLLGLAASCIFLYATVIMD